MTANTVLSDINEIQCGYFLNGSKWYSDDAKRACEQRIKQIAKELNAKLKLEPCLITMKGLAVEPIKDNWSDEL